MKFTNVGFRLSTAALMVIFGASSFSAQAVDVKDKVKVDAKTREKRDKLLKDGKDADKAEAAAAHDREKVINDTVKTGSISAASAVNSAQQAMARASLSKFETEAVKKNPGSGRIIADLHTALDQLAAADMDVTQKHANMARLELLAHTFIEANYFEADAAQILENWASGSASVKSAKVMEGKLAQLNEAARILKAEGVTDATIEAAKNATMDDIVFQFHANMKAVLSEFSKTKAGKVSNAEDVAQMNDILKSMVDISGRWAKNMKSDKVATQEIAALKAYMDWNKSQPKKRPMEDVVACGTKRGRT